jgi:RNA polymerase sigma factor (sigma-70 family)
VDDSSLSAMALDPDQPIVDVVTREASRLRRFIRRRVPDARDAEDILQDVFSELVEANRLVMPIEHVTAWLFRVARNRITDLFRRKRPDPWTAPPHELDDEDRLELEDLLPSVQGGPDVVYARRILLDELAQAIAELPEAQRAVFVAHEIDGRSFRELSVETGVSVNTLLSRKHYAVRHLRARLRTLYDEFMTG